MFDTISILIAASAFLVLLWLSIILARWLLSAILVSMQHGAQRGAQTACVPTSIRPILNSNRSIGESRRDFARR
jgi:hypothetical protein